MGVDMAAVRQAIALAEDVRFGGTKQHIDRIATFARAEPELFAAVLVALAAACSEHVSELVVLEALAGQFVDITPALLEAHRTYEMYRKARRAHLAPDWVLKGERLLQRLRMQERRERAAAEQADLRARAG